MNGLENKKILIADDDQHSCDIAEIFLKNMGLKEENIFIAKNGLEAVDIAEKELFDLILMDISMPNLNGIEASKKIKTKYNGNSPKIAAYTANAFINRNNEGMEIMDGIILKPIVLDKFKEQISDVLN